MNMITKVFEYAKRHNMLPDSGVIIAGVSGGADSMALLTVLLELAPVCGFEVNAAHFNHQLRGDESERDEKFVRDYCYEHNIPLHYGTEDTREYAAENQLGIEEAARELRYGFFKSLTHLNDSHRIATAHNLDDNAETVLLNLARGAGSRGLAGIPPTRNNIIRPLLCVSRAEIEDFLTKRNIPYVTDSTNLTDKYNRNKIRLHVTPVMKNINSAYLRHVFEAGELLRRDDEYLTSLAEGLLEKHKNHISASALATLPEVISSRVLFLLAGSSLPPVHVRQVLDMCRNNAGSKRIETVCGVFVREYDWLKFFTYNELKLQYYNDISYPVLLTPGYTATCREVTAEEVCDIFQKKGDTIHKSFNYFLFKKEEICGRIVVRPRIEGDKINILGRNVTKSLKKLFIEKKIPKNIRGQIPVIADDNGPLAVAGICRDARALPTPDAPAIEIDFVRKMNE